MAAVVIDITETGAAEAAAGIDTVVRSLTVLENGLERVERAGKKMGDGSKKAGVDVGKLKQGLGAIVGSGVVNDFDDIVGALIALGPAAGAAAAGIGLATAAVAGVGIAAFKATAFLHDAAEGTGQLDDENRALKVALDSINNTIGQAVAPTFEGLTIGVVAAALAIGDLVGTISNVIGSVTNWYKSLTPFQKGVMNGIAPSLAQLSMIEDLGAGLKDGTIALGGYTDEARTLVGAQAQLMAVEDGAAEATKRHTAAMREAAKAAREAAENAEILASVRNREFYDALGLDQELTAQIQSNSEAIVESQKTATKEIAKMHQEASLQTMDAWASTASAISQGIGFVAQQMIEGARDGSEAQQQAALVAFRVSQAASVASIGINTAVAIVKALAELGPVAGVAAGVGIGITGATQIAAVLSQPQPFHVGGEITRATGGKMPGMMPDEHLVRARDGETINTRQQQAGGQRIVVQQVYQHRVFDTFVQDNLRQSNSPLRKEVSRRSGKRLGHS